MKKGFTLLEVLVATAIGAILLSLECYIFVNSVSEYNKTIIGLRDEAYCDEGLIIIKNLIYENMLEVNSKNNEIDITTADNQLKRIHLIKNSGKVMVDYYNIYGYEYKASNVVMVNISNMTVTENGNSLYISLVDNEGESVSECFGIKEIY